MDTSWVVKPRLRGWLHAGASPAVAACGLVLVARATTPRQTFAAVVYAITGFSLFSLSAAYHRGHWSATALKIFKRIDHSNIYLLIAGTYTPVATLGLSRSLGSVLLWVVWSAAGVGVLFRCVWPGAPRLLYTGLYILLGWSVLPFSTDLLHHAGVAVFILLFTGGVLYSLGGVIYGLERPRLSPKWFGFHELFHVFTIAGWATQYAAISLLVG